MPVHPPLEYIGHLQRGFKSCSVKARAAVVKGTLSERVTVCVSLHLDIVCRGKNLCLEVVVMIVGVVLVSYCIISLPVARGRV